MQRLVERPQAEQDDHQARDAEILLVGGLRVDVADEDVVDEIGRGGEEVVVRGGDDLGEDGAHEQARRAVSSGPEPQKPCKSPV